MKQAKIIIGLLPLAYVLISYGLWIQNFRIMAGITFGFSVIFGMLVIGIIANSERK